MVKKKKKSIFWKKKKKKEKEKKKVGEWGWSCPVPIITLHFLINITSKRLWMSLKFLHRGSIFLVQSAYMRAGTYNQVPDNAKRYNTP